MNSLVKKLSVKQPVTVEDKHSTSENLTDRLKMDVVEISFPIGTTVLTRLYDPECSIPEPVLESIKGEIEICGYLTLNYEKVKCSGNVNIATLTGTGYLTAIDNDKYCKVMKYYKQKEEDSLSY
jgi:hypothetical protein